MAARNKFSLLGLDEGGDEVHDVSNGPAPKARSEADAKTKTRGEQMTSATQGSRKDTMKVAKTTPPDVSGSSRELAKNAGEARRKYVSDRGERTGRDGRGRGNPRGRGREYDRHSGSGRHDSQKKEVAGKGSWGDPVDDSPKPDNVEESQQPPEETAFENGEVNGEEVKPEPEPEPEQITFEEFLASRKTVTSTFQMRQANDGENSFKDAKALNKRVVHDFPERISVGGKAGGHKEKKPAAAKKEKKLLEITTPRGRFGERGGRGRGDRPARGTGGRGFGGARGGAPRYREEQSGGLVEPFESSWDSQRVDPQVDLADELNFPKL